MWTVNRRIDAAPESVWQRLVDLDAWPQWGLTVARAELTGADELSLGARGTVWTPIGAPLPFEITEFVPLRRWAWRVAGIAATQHGVDPEGDGCRLWMSAPVWAPAYLPVLAVALRRIDSYTSSPHA
jgi:Polyketide cyclase / dehydrase and lipid transport